MEHVLAPTSDPHHATRRAYPVIVQLTDLAAPVALAAAVTIHRQEHCGLPTRHATGPDLLGAERWELTRRRALDVVSGAQVPLHDFGGEVDLGSATVEELAAKVAANVLDDIPVPEPPTPTGTARIVVRRIGPAGGAACAGTEAA